MAGDNSSNEPRGRRSWRNPALSLLAAALFLTLITKTAAGQSPFHAGGFQPDDVKLNFPTAKWYLDQLATPQESSLPELKQDPSVQGYRFVWQRSFHRPVMVRVLIHPDGSAILVAKMGAREEGHKPSDLPATQTRLLPADRVSKLISKIQSLKYWTLPEDDPNPPGLDGSKWVIEGVDHGKYRVVNRWSPKKGPVRELGLLFLRLSQLNLRNEPVY
jgi:hypothetical protein